MAEFDWWLLVLGLVVGGGLVYLVLAEGARREADVEAEELEAEASFIAGRLLEHGVRLDREDVADVLREHRAYLHLPPPDAISGAAPDVPAPTEAAAPAEPERRLGRESIAPSALPDGETRA